jgi:hypothetical protein
LRAQLSRQLVGRFFCGRVSAKAIRHLSDAFAVEAFPIQIAPETRIDARAL